MPFFQTSTGGQLWYEDTGCGKSGRTVLLTHGWCMSGAVWQLQREALEEQYRLLIPDLRGHGRSVPPSTGMGGFDGYAADLTELLVFLDLSGLVAVGWSLGAQALLKAYPAIRQRLAGLALVGATPRFTAAPHFPYGLQAVEAEGMRLKVRRNLDRALEGFHRRMFVDGELDDPGVASRVRGALAAVVPPSAAAALEGLESLMTAEMMEEARQVSCPTLLIHGDQDPICLPEASLWLQQAIAGSYRLLYPCCGHGPFLSRATRFNSDLQAFIARLSGDD